MTPVPVLTAPAPGPVAVAPGGTVYLAVQPSPGVPAQLLASPDGGATWSDVADQVYRSTALLPYRLVAGPSGGVWVTLAGNGVLRGLP
jgi:hypothetical protein